MHVDIDFRKHLYACKYKCRGEKKNRQMGRAHTQQDAKLRLNKDRSVIWYKKMLLRVAFHYPTQYIWNVFSPKLSWMPNHLKVSPLYTAELSTLARKITFKERCSISKEKHPIL